MHAGEHHLPVTGGDEFRHLGQDVGGGKAAIRPSRQRDDAVGAAGVAAVLNLHEGPGVPGKCGDQRERRPRPGSERRRGDALGARPAVIVEMVENRSFSRLPRTRSTSGIPAIVPGCAWARQPVAITVAPGDSRRALRSAARQRESDCAVTVQVFTTTTSAGSPKAIGRHPARRTGARCRSSRAG